MTEKKIEQSKLGKFVYNLIYPAILGSILYSLLPWKNNVEYYIGLGIFIFYILDYVHLYFIMETKFNQKEKNKLSYIIFDLLVSVLLFVAFQYYKINPMLAILSLSLIPLCFLLYSLPLKYNTLFYKLYFALTTLYTGLLIINFQMKDSFLEVRNDYSLLILVFGMITIYLVYVIRQFYNNKKEY